MVGILMSSQNESIGSCIAGGDPRMRGYCDTAFIVYIIKPAWYRIFAWRG